MKRTLLLLAASLGLLSTAQADMVEGNVTIQLKLTRQAAPSSTSTFTTKKQTVSTYKNADFIKQIGDARGTPFSKSAKLIFKRTTSTNPDYYIRDAGTDYEVTDSFYIGPRLDVSPIPAAIATGKTSNFFPKTGSEKVASLGTLVLSSEGGEIADLVLQGSYLESTQYVRAKENPDLTTAITLRSVTGYGHFYFPGSDRGLLQGTVKLSGAKNLPYPDDD